MDIYLLHVNCIFEGAFASLESAMVYEEGKQLSWTKYDNVNQNAWFAKSDGSGEIVRQIFKYPVKG